MLGRCEHETNTAIVCANRGSPSAYARRRCHGRPLEPKLSAGCQFGVALPLLEFGVEASGFGELVFEDDDAAGCVECGARGDEFVGSCGDA